MDLRLSRYFVTVAEERHFGRSAARLHMTQPPLSRAIQRLEAELGTALLHRSAAGVDLTPAGHALHDEARLLLEQADHLPALVAAAAGARTIAIGTLGESAEVAGPRLAPAFRDRHPDVAIHLREADLGDPTAGLRAGLVDVAITRLPFDDEGITTVPLHSEPVGAVLRADDPLATRTSLTLDDLADRPWRRLPDEGEPAWRAYWNGADSTDGPVLRTIQECLQSALWNGTTTLAPRSRAMPGGLVCVPLADVPRSRVVLAWNTGDTNPLIRSLSACTTG